MYTCLWFQADDQESGNNSQGEDEEEGAVLEEDGGERSQKVSCPTLFLLKCG